MPEIFQKLVSVLTTLIPVTMASKKANIALEKVFCIDFLLCFWKNIIDIRALIDSGSKINAMTLAYINKLDFKVCFTNVGA